jgi:8-oxo-dGTP diphosphatase
MTERLHVAAGVIVNNAGEILIAKRHDHLHQGGLWEFPGGKLEPGEQASQALQRELKEELGISAVTMRPLIRVHHDYPDRHVLLDVWYVSGFGGQAHGREGQSVTWVRTDDLRQYDFPAANQPILYAAQLPDRYLVTPEPEDTTVFMQQFEAALLSGIQLVQLRAHSLSDAEYISLARQCQHCCRQHNARMLVNRDVKVFEAIEADGIHLTGSRLQECKARPVAQHKLFSASCHTLDDITQANTLGADFVVAGAVKPTASHAGIEPLGWQQFQALTEKAVMPVYALGGMQESDKQTAWQYGGQGIAAIRSLWEKP